MDRQFGHSGRPVASRVAGSRTAPQRAQGTAAVRAKQVRQIRCPSCSLDSATTRSQRGHDGRVMLLAHDEDEQVAGLHTMLVENLAVPFQTQVLGVDVTVEDIDLTGRAQIVAICCRGR